MQSLSHYLPLLVASRSLFLLPSSFFLACPHGVERIPPFSRSWRENVTQSMNSRLNHHFRAKSFFGTAGSLVGLLWTDECWTPNYLPLRR
jgi:hypothetical protein